MKGISRICKELKIKQERLKNRMEEKKRCRRNKKLILEIEEYGMLLKKLEKRKREELER